MQTELPSDVLAFGRTAWSRFDSLGGVDLALRAETDPEARGSALDALDQLGAWDVDPRAGYDELLAAAQLCRMSGAVALPVPVVERLLAIDGSWLALVDPGRPWIDHGDLPGPWIGADLDGRAFAVEPAERHPAKLGPFVTRARLGEPVLPVPADDVARHLALGAWRILGGLDTALGQATAHVGVRKQFGQPLAEFQAVRFAVADAAVAVRGLDQLARFTMWRLATADPEARWADAVALRLYAVETARDVLRCCHQLLGAIGFCDEHDVSVLDRHLQPLLRLPYSAEALAERLVPSVADGSLEALFS
jgi:acyl-CoA dehydrogenase